jgi:hypothetical protein
LPNRQDPWNEWNPANVAADKKETLTLGIRPDTKSTDGWWDYNRLFADGVLTIDAHFGWDYNTEAAHLVDSKMFYSWLLDHGFKSPVSSWDKYSRTSGPLTRTLDADGKTVRVEVRIFYPRPGTSTDPDTDAGGKQMEKDMFASLASRDVIVYSGHSGPLYGFALANWDKTDEGDVDDTELAVTPLWSGHYQIVMAEGCNTYMLGSTLMKNPSKQGKDIDIITTTSFSVSYSPVEDFIGRLIELDSQGNTARARCRRRSRTSTSTVSASPLRPCTASTASTTTRSCTRTRIPRTRASRAARTRSVAASAMRASRSERAGAAARPRVPTTAAARLAISARRSHPPRRRRSTAPTAYRRRGRVLSAQRSDSRP